MKKAIHILFLCGVFAILVAGLIRTVFFQEEFNLYENRYAAKLPGPTVAGFLEGSFQDGVESALMDQVNGAQTLKSLYNMCTTQTQKNLLDAISDSVGLDGRQYVEFGGLRLFGDGYDHITYWPQYSGNIQEKMDQKAASLNRTFAQHPELDFYVYFIEKDTEMDFETGQNTGVSEKMLSALQLPEERKGCYSVSDFEEFAARYYRTDHHWNYEGAYQGYLSLLPFLGCEDLPLEPTGDPILVGTEFSGSKAKGIGGDWVFRENFYAYSFDYPPMEVCVNGIPVEDYGQQTEWLSGEVPERLSYSSFYGGDNGETILSTGTTGRGNLLVVGESFDNAILKLLASHYDTLFSVDLRNYSIAMGSPFQLEEYTRKHDIQKVLLIGNVDYFTEEIFALEG